MNVVPYRTSEEKVILTGMIVSDEVLNKLIKPIMSNDHCFSSRWSNIVSRWCVSYFNKYGKAPNRSIEGLFAKWAEKTRDQETVDLVETFLSTLSSDYQSSKDGVNVQFIVDLAIRTFKKNALRHLSEMLDAHVDDDEVDQAELRLTQYIDTPFTDSNSIISVLTDDEALNQAFVDQGEALVVYPGSLGSFFDTHLEREGFIALLAPEKRGKSFWLIDIAWMAQKQRRNTLFYSVGDMSQSQMIRRFGMRASRRPLKPGDYRLPRNIKRVDKSSVVKYQKRTYKVGLSPQLVKKAFAKAAMLSGTKEGRLRMKSTPNSTTSVADIRADVIDQIRQGWVPDVVVIDYADILAPEPGSGAKETRHQINETWKALRRLSQEFHILVVTATQSDALGGDAELLSKRHFSEDKRKAAHVTGMIGLNQTPEEKDKGVYRLNWIYLREGSYSEHRVVRVAGNLGLGSPAVVSCF